MIGRMVLCLVLVFRAGAAFGQEPACGLYRVNASVLPISTVAGGPANKGGLFDGDITCVTRTQPVDGLRWGYISYTLDNAKARTPVEGWSALELLQALTTAEAALLGGVAPPRAPVVPPPAASAPALAAVVGAPPQPTSPPPAQAQAGEAERMWAHVKDTTDIRTLEVFREQYGAANPLVGRLAEARIEELKKKQVGVITPQPAAAASPFDAAGKACEEEREDLQLLACTELIQRNQKDATAYFNRALAYYEKKDFDRAVADTSKAIDLNPNYAVAYNRRSATYNAKGDHDRAIADANKAIEIDPKLATAYGNRGNAYYNKKQYDRAIADANKAIGIDPKLARAYNNRGLAYRAKGDTDRAIADYSKAVDIDPKSTYAYISRGITYAEKGDRNRAITDFSNALQIDPQSKDAREALAKLRANP
jgi:tetratricopeptide (TPR) repeat protein